MIENAMARPGFSPSFGVGSWGEARCLTGGFQMMRQPQQNIDEGFYISAGGVSIIAAEADAAGLAELLQVQPR